MKITALVDVKNLTKVFLDKKNKREIRAVDGISFKLNAGEIFGFLGPNGAGKTTTIRVLAGLLPPTSGYASIFGQDIEKVGDRVRKHIGFLTENHGNYENLTVYENLHFFGSFYDIDDLDARISAILEEIKLTDRKNMKVGKLSKGLKQRAALARVLIHEPKIVFLDEPTAALDPEAAVNVRNIIRTLKSKDKIIFINSHNLEEVQKVCDRVAILNKGKILRMGSASELNKDIFGSQELLIKTKSPIPRDLLAAISDLDYIKNVRVDESLEANLYLHLSNLECYTPEIVKLLVNNNIPIMEVRPQSHSLEEIYLTLMKETNEDLIISQNKEVE
ncbi:MAG: ATP-binding cassette domain-containing protein [Candidatus Lokiarchaeota archaeon]|nr:ATP-binding cassette domain-containing protein [Candidatus Lokiarchaeota archaeon]